MVCAGDDSALAEKGERKRKQISNNNKGILVAIK
jgi:hypothetical protein